MLTLGQAAKEVGLAKSVLSRAIKSGKLSATRSDDGSFRIDPAELFRVYQSNRSWNTSGEQLATPQEHHQQHPKNTHSPAEVALLRELIEEIREERDSLRGERDKLLSLLADQTAVTRQLTHQPTETLPVAAPTDLSIPGAGPLQARTWLLLLLAAVLGFGGAYLSSRLFSW